MWVLDVSKLTLRFPAALQFFNNPSTSFLQWDILAYTALDAYYPLLLFLAFGHYGFIPELYNTPTLFPHDSLDAAKVDHLAETIIAAFHNVALSDVLPTQLCQSNLSYHFANRPHRDYARRGALCLQIFHVQLHMD
uniref:Uncharacterized protein n=1 Tax=Romanomermis culicivorax TaxID=13658 RepID=A0A915IV50_ROMCU